MVKVLSGWFEAYTAATPLRRLGLALLLALPVAAAVALWLWLHQPPYKVLYARLSDRAGGEVMAALDQLGISYRLSERDGAIEVPADQTYSARFKLAARGLPRADGQASDAAVASAPAFGQSQFQEQLHYQHALSTELVRSIESIQTVTRARVHLAIPKVSPFLREPPPVTAAVLLELKPDPAHPGAALAQDQVHAIQRMVAASVPRLHASDVSVLDQQGRLLGADSDTPEATRTRLEAALAERASASLAALFGAGRVKVQTSASMLPDGRVRRIDAAVILALDATPQQLAQATTLARQALGLNARRGDRLSVFALPPPPAPSPQTAAARPLPAAPSADTLLPSLWPWVAVLVAAFGVIALVLRRRRQRARTPNQAADTAGDDFDAELQHARRLSLDNPRVTADVIRLWMRA